MHSAKGSKNSRKMHRNVVPLSYPYPAQRRPFTANLVRLWGYFCGHITERNVSSSILPPSPPSHSQTFQPSNLATISFSKSMLTLSWLGVQRSLLSIFHHHHSAFGKVRLNNVFMLSACCMFYLLCYVYNITLNGRLVKYIRKLFLSFFMTECSGKTCEGSVVGCATGAGRVMW